MQTWAIRNGEPHHGTTLHQMGKDLDDGPIVASVQVPITDTDTAYTLTERCNEAAVPMLDEWIPRLLETPDFDPVPPDPNPVAHREADLSREITLGHVSAEFDRHVRALTYPGMPSPYVTHGGGRWLIQPDR